MTTTTESKPEMKEFFVSLSRDLLHVYIRFLAVSELAVQQYLQYGYYSRGVWKLPWCSIYTSLDEIVDRQEAIVVNSKCGPLYEEEQV